MIEINWLFSGHMKSVPLMFTQVNKFITLIWIMFHYGLSAFQRPNLTKVSVFLCRGVSTTNALRPIFGPNLGLKFTFQLFSCGPPATNSTNLRHIYEVRQQITPCRLIHRTKPIILFHICSPQQKICNSSCQII